MAPITWVINTLAGSDEVQVVFEAPLVATRHGRALIHLVTLPDETSDFLNDLPLARGGFGSIKVEAGVGKTTWNSSVFPDGDSFLLLIAKKLITQENLEVGKLIEVTLEI